MSKRMSGFLVLLLAVVYGLVGIPVRNSAGAANPQRARVAGSSPRHDAIVVTTDQVLKGNQRYPATAHYQVGQKRGTVSRGAALSQSHREN